MLTPKTIEQAEAELLKVAQIDCPITHHFMPGCYIREMAAPADTYILGHEHVTDHTCLLLKGTIRLITEANQAIELTAPAIFAATPGRKVGYAVTDIIFCNLHVTDETDVNKIEKQVIKKSEAWQQHQLDQCKLKLIRGDK